MAIPGSIKAIKSLMQWTARDPWAERFKAWTDGYNRDVGGSFEIGEESLGETMNPDLYECFMVMVAEDFLCSCRDDDGHTAVEDYLKRRGWKESAGVRRYLEALSDSVTSLYEVVHVDPGRCIVVKDVLRDGEPLRIEDKTISLNAAIWDRIAARALLIGGKNYLSETMMPLDFDTADDFEELVEAAITEARETGEAVDMDTVLRGVLPEWIRFWLMSFDEEGTLFIDDDGFAGNGFESDAGDDVPNLVFPIEGDQDKVVAVLDSHPEFQRLDREKIWWWRDGESESPSLEPEPEDEAGEHLGLVTIFLDKMMVTTGERETHDRIKALVRETMGALVGEAVETEILYEPDDAWDLPEAANDDGLEEYDPGTVEGLHETLVRFLDEKFPELDGLSPREAAAREQHVEQVVVLLKTLENANWQAAETNIMPRYDFRWIWEELGLADRRWEPAR